MMNSKIKVSSKSCYHIYVLSAADCDLIIKNKDNCIGFFVKNNVKRRDVIMIYQKERSKCGFYGIVQLGSEAEMNGKNIKIFTDVNMNRYCAKLCFKQRFLDIISPDVI